VTEHLYRCHCYENHRSILRQRIDRLGDGSVMHKLPVGSQRPGADRASQRQTGGSRSDDSPPAKAGLARRNQSAHDGLGIVEPFVSDSQWRGGGGYHLALGPLDWRRVRARGVLGRRWTAVKCR
jgi:hypothetical protein